MVVYRSPSGAAAIGTAITIASEDINEALHANDTCAADLMLIAVASRSIAAAAAATGAGLNLDRSGSSSGGQGDDGESSGELHVGCRKKL